MDKIRNDNELPEAIANWGWKYHHIGIPTTIRHENEYHVPHLKIHVAGFENSPYGIQWMRYDEDCPISDIIRTVPHIAFEVADLEKALLGKEVITEPNSPSEGVRVAMIIHNGAPIELIEFKDKS